MANLTRRQSLGLLAAASIPSTAVVAIASATPSLETAQTRFDYHLAELKKAAEELDPSIGRCQTNTDWGGGFGCGVLITAFRVTGRYEGNGSYATGRAKSSGDRTRYRVRLLDDKNGAERAFEVSTYTNRMVLSESHLNTFIGRRLCKPKGGV